MTARFTIDTDADTARDTWTGLKWCRRLHRVIPGHSGITQAAKGTWADKTDYSVGDVVFDDNTISPYSNWAADTDYASGDMATAQDGDGKYHGVRAKSAAATSSDFRPPDSGTAGHYEWDTYWTSYGSVGNPWTIYGYDYYTAYGVGKWVKDGGHYYQCISATPANDHQPYVGSGSDWYSYWHSLNDSCWGWYPPFWASVGDYLNIAGVFYKCKVANQASGGEPGFYSSGTWSDWWVSAGSSIDTIVYPAGALVTGSDYAIYECILGFDNSGGGSDPTTDTTHWAAYTGTPDAWASGTTYSVGDVVLGNDSAKYWCKLGYTASRHKPTVDSDWETYWEDVTTDAPDWQRDYSYTAGDYVNANGYTFICTADNLSSPAEPGVDSDWETYWVERTTSNWTYGNSYAANAYVITDPTGYPYAAKCKVAHFASQKQPWTDTGWGSYWDDFGIFQDPPGWNYGNLYHVGDWVRDNNYGSGSFGPRYAIYECITQHTADYSNMLWSTATGYTKWKMVSTVFACISAHTSSGWTNEPGMGSSWSSKWVALPFMDNASSVEAPTRMPWRFCLDFINNLTWNGISDWHMPNFNEQMSILQFNDMTNYTDDDVFPITGLYWTSTHQHGPYNYSSKFVVDTAGMHLDIGNDADGEFNPATAPYCYAVTSS